jgi:hypothetical protein
MAVGSPTPTMRTVDTFSIDYHRPPPAVAEGDNEDADGADTADPEANAADEEAVALLASLSIAADDDEVASNGRATGATTAAATATIDAANRALAKASTAAAGADTVPQTPPLNTTPNDFLQTPLLPASDRLRLDD